MFFASDNGGPVPRQILDALARANQGYAMPYGNDDLTANIQNRIRDLFEAPDAVVHLVGTGTAANALILGTLANPWDGIFCTPMAHIVEDECNAPEFYSDGAKLIHVPAKGGKMQPEALAEVILETGGSVHNAQRGPLSLTNVTEDGTLYTLEEIRALTDIAQSHGIATHLDGARFANALVALDCAPADMTWRAGIDAVSFGGTKNGLMGVEAAIFFNPDHGREFELRRKRGAHLFSKGRFLAAQMDGYLTDDLWLDLARQANGHCARLAAGLAATPGVRLLNPAPANLLFAEMPRALHQRLHEAGARYYLHGELDGPADDRLTARFVCDWSIGDGVEALLAAL